MRRKRSRVSEAGAAGVFRFAGTLEEDSFAAGWEAGIQVRGTADRQGTQC